MALAPLSDGARNSNETETRMVVTLALILTFSPGEKEQRSRLSGFADDRPANPVAGSSVRRRKILPLCPSPIGWERVAEGRVRD